MVSAKQATKALGQTVFGMMLVAGIGRAQAGEIHRIVDFDNNISLAFVHSHVEYGERLNPPKGAYLDTDSGFVNGGRVSFSAMGSDVLPNIYIHGSYQQTTGSLGYTGGIIGTTTSLSMGQNSSIRDYGFRLGQGVPIAGWSMLVPFLTYGTHHWVRGEAPTVTSPYDYQETYNNNYFGLGAMWQAMLAHHLVTSVTAIYGRTMNPTIETPFFSEGLGPKAWLRGGLSIDYILGRHESVFAGVTFTKFQYGAGAGVSLGTAAYGYEPFSQTETTDYRIGIRFLI